VERIVLSALRELDAAVARLLSLAGPEAGIVLTSDHGMAPIDTIVYPNVLLHRRGWLALAPTGEIDPARTACLFHPAENGLLALNVGVMSARGLHIDELLSTLNADIAEVTGHKSKVLEFRCGSPLPHWCTDFYLMPGQGCQAKADVGSVSSARTRKTGDHCVHSDAIELQGVVVDLQGGLLPAGGMPLETHEVAPLLYSRTM
jgi:hypothetical protein